MGKATIINGRALAGYIGETAVDSEGKTIEGAPPRPANTDPSKQPGAVGAQTSEERIGLAIASALRGTPVVSGAKTEATAAEATEETELPPISQLEEHIADLSRAEVEALQSRDERKGAVKVYEARLAELDGE